MSSSSSEDSPVPAERGRGFSRLETLPEGVVPAFDPGVGDLIGERYRIVAPLGNGAMGRVFLAENVAISLRVAIKLLKPELLANPHFRLRFRHEAEAVARVQHPNVARFLDLVVGNPTFLVMEYVDGPTLDDLLKREGPLQPRRAVDMAIRLCWGLHAAHRVGVVHRDFKPTNILLQNDEERGEQPKIIDFGLAKFESADTPLTRTGQIVGTPHYMAPEQIGGKEVDARTDVYAVGCVLYAMLTGRPPFTGNTDDVQVLYRQVHENPEPLSSLAPGVTPMLDAVVARALAKDPAQRYATMKELAQALGPTVERRRPSQVRDGGSLALRLPPPRRGRAFAAGFVLAAAIAGVAALSLRPPPPPPAPADTLLLIKTDPPAATVILDGKPLAEPTPTALRGLAPGKHVLTFQRPHFTVESRAVTLPEHGRETVELHLSPSSHPVEINTVPTGASVFLDGNLVAGKTPVTVQITDDEFHGLRIEKNGYDAFEKHIVPEDSTALGTIALQPERFARGKLFVDAAVPSEVWVDGSPTGFFTPTPGLRVLAGEHKVSLVVNGLSGEPVPVHVGKGENVRVALQAPARRRR